MVHSKTLLLIASSRFSDLLYKKAVLIFGVKNVFLAQRPEDAVQYFEEQFPSFVLLDPTGYPGSMLAPDLFPRWKQMRKFRLILLQEEKTPDNFPADARLQPPFSLSGDLFNNLLPKKKSTSTGRSKVTPREQDYMKFLKQVGFPTSRAGFSILAAALLLYERSEKARTNMVTGLYPLLAKRFQLSSKNTERAITRLLNAGRDCLETQKKLKDALSLPQNIEEDYFTCKRFLKIVTERIIYNKRA